MGSMRATRALNWNNYSSENKFCVVTPNAVPVCLARRLATTFVIVRVLKNKQQIDLLFSEVLALRASQDRFHALYICNC